MCILYKLVPLYLHTGPYHYCASLQCPSGHEPLAPTRLKQHTCCRCQTVLLPLYQCVQTGIYMQVLIWPQVMDSVVDFSFAESMTGMAEGWREGGRPWQATQAWSDKAQCAGMSKWNRYWKVVPMVWGDASTSGWQQQRRGGACNELSVPYIHIHMTLTHCLLLVSSQSVYSLGLDQYSQVCTLGSRKHWSSQWPSGT